MTSSKIVKDFPELELTKLTNIMIPEFTSSQELIAVCCLQHILMFVQTSAFNSSWFDEFRQEYPGKERSSLSTSAELCGNQDVFDHNSSVFVCISGYITTQQED